MFNVLKGIYRLFRCIREFVISLFFILFVLILFAIVSAFNNNETRSNTSPKPFNEGALILNLDGYLADNHDEFSNFNRFLNSEITGKRQPLKISSFDVAQAIRHAKHNPKIKGIVLDLRYFQGADLPTLQYIGEMLTSFKNAEKPIIAIGDYFTQQQYYLASYADKIYLNQAGFIQLHGLNYSNLYFKSLFEKIEAVPHIFRVGTYKSAVEPFIRDDMSPEARQNAQLWLTKLWQNFSNDIAQNRNIEPNQLIPTPERYLTQYRAVKGDDARYALNQKWVNDILTDQEINDRLIEQFGKNQDGEYNGVDFFDYLTHLPDRFSANGTHKIAVVNVEGAIMLGESDENTAGSDTIVKLLKQARQDTQVKGVILRINSPGGSAMASELIRQEVENIQKAGKPVVASMGGMAASGGYWIAATADKIIASPTTLTGSIGIFGLAVTFEKTAKNLGITEDGITTSPFAPQSALKTLPQAQAELLQISIENGYQRFLELVSRGRKMSLAEVDNIAQGQVWIGESAFEKGLVDQIGSFSDAHDAITALLNQKREANGEETLTHFPTFWIVEESQDLLSQFMRDFKMQIRSQALNWLGISLPIKFQNQLGVLTEFDDPQHRYLYCLNCGTVK